MTNVGDITFSLGDPVTYHPTPAPPTNQSQTVQLLESRCIKHGEEKQKGVICFAGGQIVADSPHNAKLIWDT